MACSRDQSRPVSICKVSGPVGNERFSETPRTGRQASELAPQVPQAAGPGLEPSQASLGPGDREAGLRESGTFASRGPGDKRRRPVGGHAASPRSAFLPSGGPSGAVGLDHRPAPLGRPRPNVGLCRPGLPPGGAKGRAERRLGGRQSLPSSQGSGAPISGKENVLFFFSCCASPLPHCLAAFWRHKGSCGFSGLQRNHRGWGQSTQSLMAQGRQRSGPCAGGGLGAGWWEQLP